MALTKCPECGRGVSSAARICSACGAEMAAPAQTTAEKKPMTTGVKVLIGCGIAAGIGVIIIPIIGLLAAIAIPSFVKARSTSQQNMCINNLRQIDGAKEQWAMAENKSEGDAIELHEVNQYIKGGTTPTCARGGDYDYKKIGEDPECSIEGHQFGGW